MADIIAGGLNIRVVSEGGRSFFEARNDAGDLLYRREATADEIATFQSGGGGEFSVGSKLSQPTLHPGRWRR